MAEDGNHSAFNISYFEKSSAFFLPPNILESSRPFFK